MDRPRRYGFVVHPLGRAQQLLFRAWTRLRGPGRVLDFPPLYSLTGHWLEGRIVGVPFTPAEMIADQAQAVAGIIAAAESLHAWGARCVGLGAVAAVVGGRGRAVAQALSPPVTTGHALTTYAAMRTADLAATHFELDPAAPVAVLGAPGPVALGLAACLAAQGNAVRLALDPLPPPVARFLRAWPAAQAVPKPQALDECRLVLGASSTGDAVQEHELRPDAIFVDVAQPRDLVEPPRGRGVSVLDGELVSLPPGAELPPLSRIYNRIVGQGSRHILACFAEPMVLALLDPAWARRLSRPARFPRPADILTLGSLAERAGFRVDRLFQYGRPLTTLGAPRA